MNIKKHYAAKFLIFLFSFLFCDKILLSLMRLPTCDLSGLEKVKDHILKNKRKLPKHVVVILNYYYYILFCSFVMETRDEEKKICTSLDQ